MVLNINAHLNLGNVMCNYSVSHKVEISERFKSHWNDFKGQSSNLKHVEKIDEYKRHGKNVDIQMTNLMLNCLFLTFSNVRLFQIYGIDYTMQINLNKNPKKSVNKIMLIKLSKY